MILPTLLLASTLVLHNGERIVTVGDPVRQGNVITFRAPGGTLYSIPASEVDQSATEAANAAPSTDEQEKARKPIVVSASDRERLLSALARNHAGTPAPPQRSLEEPPPTPTPSETASKTEDEWRWRRESRGYQEALRQATENLQLLVGRAERLRSEIRGLLALGWKPKDFTYQTTTLAYVEEQIPDAQLAVDRAQRAWDQFRDDARRQGVMPGWIR